MNVSNEDLMEQLDKVMGKLRSIEDEFTLQMGKYENIGDLENKIEELERRIKKLESSVT